MDAVPEPDLVHAQRMLAACPDASPDARRVVEDVCGYAKALWDELHEVREYLLSSTEIGHARPAGPRDEVGWANWMDMYARVTRALTGRDHGQGPAPAPDEATDEATDEARRRRHLGGPPGDAQPS